MKKFLRNTLFLFGFFPICAFALVYQYDPLPRVQSLQANYPGGVSAIYHYCVTRFEAKQAALAAIGVTQASAKPQDAYPFMAECIYGKSAYKSASCGYGGVACQKIALPVTLSALNDMTKNIQPHPVAQVAMHNIY